MALARGEGGALCCVVELVEAGRTEGSLCPKIPCVLGENESGGSHTEGSRGLFSGASRMEG